MISQIEFMTQPVKKVIYNHYSKNTSDHVIITVESIILASQFVWSMGLFEYILNLQRFFCVILEFYAITYHGGPL